MTTLVDDLVPDELWALVAPLLPARRARPMAAGTAPSRIGPAWPRSCTWRAPRLDRGKRGSKLHLVCDGSGLPLAEVVTAANVNDTTMFQALVGDIPPIGRRLGGGAPTRQGPRRQEL
jgi:hypothetical protein